MANRPILFLLHNIFVLFFFFVYNLFVVTYIYIHDVDFFPDMAEGIVWNYGWYVYHKSLQYIKY